MKKMILVLLLLPVVFYCDNKAKARETFKQGVELANKGKYDEAIVMLKLVLEYGSLDADVHLNLAIVYANKKQYDEAVKEAELAAKAKSDSLTTYYLLGMLYEKKNDNEKALSAWQRVLELKPRETMKELAEKHVQRLKGN
ncbi:MAG: tetratricopeptide repeat protein [Candidatus Firestonebacteria bacterium]